MFIWGSWIKKLLVLVHTPIAILVNHGSHFRILSLGAIAVAAAMQVVSECSLRHYAGNSYPKISTIQSLIMIFKKLIHYSWAIYDTIEQYLKVYSDRQVDILSWEINTESLQHCSGTKYDVVLSFHQFVDF